MRTCCHSNVPSRRHVGDDRRFRYCGSQADVHELRVAQDILDLVAVNNRAVGARMLSLTNSSVSKFPGPDDRRQLAARHTPAKARQ